MDKIRDYGSLAIGSSPIKQKGSLLSAFRARQPELTHRVHSRETLEKPDNLDHVIENGSQYTVTVLK